jgi:hypothetical protein
MKDPKYLKICEVEGSVYKYAHLTQYRKDGELSTIEMWHMMASILPTVGVIFAVFFALVEPAGSAGRFIRSISPGLDVIIILLVALLLYALWKYASKRRGRIDARYRADPLYVKSWLLLKAHEALKTHEEYYTALFKAASCGRQEISEIDADRYYAFIERTNRAVEKEMGRVSVSTDLHFANRHLQQRSPELANLMTEQRELIELPPVIDIPNVLDEQDELNAIAEELESTISGGKVDLSAVDARLARAQKTRVLETDPANNEGQPQNASLANTTR